MKRVDTNTIIGIVFAALAAVWYYMSTQITNQSEMGPAFFPRIASGAMFICSLLLIIQSLVKKEKFRVTFSKDSMLKVGALTVLIFIYTLVMPKVGFLISTIVLFGITMALFKLENKKVFIVVLLAAPTVLYVVFKYLLSVPLP